MVMIHAMGSLGAHRGLFSGLGSRKAGARLGAAVAGLLAACGSAQAQWTALTHNPPAAINLMLLLPDGTVMASNNNGTGTIGRGWYRLTPDSHGSYVNGTWTTLASMIDTRLYYSAQVLRDGRVFVAGGEYGTGAAHAEVYNPQTNTWTAVNPPISLLNPSATSPATGGSQGFVDSNSEILPNGNVLIAPVSPAVSGQPLIYNPTANTWAAGPNYVRGVYQDEAAWVKLPDNSILTIDPFGTNTERYIPASNVWVNDGVVPVAVYDPFGDELGPNFLCANGKAFQLGSTGHTAIYTPSGSTSPGSWIAGPDIPGSHGMPDAPAAMMVTGHILCAVSPVPTSANHFPTPTVFYEYDPVANAFTSVNAPVGSSDNISSYMAAMLALPDGNVMYSHFNTSVYIYHPTGTTLALGKPVVQSVTANADGSFHLTGTGLNGISEGAAYGDDLQMASNYPLVRLADGSGNVYYARTFNWSSSSVMTGAQVLSTEFKIPVVPQGNYSLFEVANGFSSDPCDGPTVTGQGNAVSACPGTSVSFSVTAGGAGAPVYQWRRGSTPLVNGGNISGADTATLTINPIGVGDADTNYNCALTTMCGVAIGPSNSIVVTPGGYANCDGSTSDPVLNVADFLCFLQRFQTGDPYANCDASTTPPVLNVADFTCFLQKFSQGCQ
jgi:Galactose oxidase, central domain